MATAAATSNGDIYVDLERALSAGYDAAFRPEVPWQDQREAMFTAKTARMRNGCLAGNAEFDEFVAQRTR